MQRMPSNKRLKRVARILFKKDQDPLVEVAMIDENHETLEQARAAIARTSQVELPHNFQLYTSNVEVTPMVWGQFLAGKRGERMICNIRSSNAYAATNGELSFPPQFAPAPPFVKNANFEMRERRMKSVRNQMGDRFRQYNLSIQIPQGVGGEKGRGQANGDRGAESEVVVGDITLTWAVPNDCSTADRLHGDLILNPGDQPISIMAVVCGMCALPGEYPNMEFELLSGATDSPLHALHKRMVDQQAVIWIPEYGTDNELYLLAIFVVPPDPEWWPDDEPTEIPVFLGYISKRDPLSKPDQKWTGSPVLRECHRLWRKKTPLVLDLDETLGCSPSDCFHPEQDAPDHLEKEVREHIGNVEPGMNAAKQEAFYQNLIKSWTHEKEKAMWAHMQYNRSIKVRTRVQAMDRLLKSDLPADSSMLLDACDQQYFLYTEGSVQRVLFLRPHLTKLLKLALTEFDTYIVTAATEEHSKVFFSAMDHFFRDKKPGNHFLFDLDESGQKLTHALGSAAACSEKKLETTSRTSHFSTIIVDDCRGSRGIGSGCGAEQTWPHDMRSVYTVKAWNPIQADADHDDELEKLAGWEGASGVLLRCSRDFFDKLGSFSNKMASSNGWYDAKTHCAKKGFEPPRMNEEVDVQLKNRAQRPSSPRASTLECLVLDTNSLIQMCARDQNVDINAPQNLIPNYADCFKVLEKIIVNLSGRIKVVIPYVVVRELDKLKEKMVDGGPTQTAKAARRANKYLSDQGDAEVLEMEKDPLKELDKKIHFAKLRGENAEDAIHLRHEYNKLNTNDARIVHQTLQRINVHNCVILTNDNNMKLVAKQNGIDCLNLHEVSDYVLNRNKEHAQNMLPTVWVERRNARAKSEMEAQAGAASVLPSQGKMRWQTEHSTSRPGTRKYYFNWRENRYCLQNGRILQNRSQYNRPTEAPPAPWYYKDSSEVEQGPLELHMQIVRMVSSGVLNSESFEQVMPSLQKLHEDHKISNDTLVRSEHTDDKWRSYRDVVSHG